MMKPMSVRTGVFSPAPQSRSMSSQSRQWSAGDEINIISRRDVLPLLDNARQILSHYDNAMGCSIAVLDSSGRMVEAAQSTKRDCSSPRPAPLCGLCINHAQCPCGEIHHRALAQSRQDEGVYVYSCAAGFVFWTSPLYRNGRYAGALTAGQVILSEVSCAGRSKVLEKFRALCSDEKSVQKFSAMLENVPEKNHDEIKAMAEMLGICAGEISERREEPRQILRRKTWQNVSSKNFVKLSDSPFNTSETEDPRRGLLEKERMLLAAFRRGDNETGGKMLKELMLCILAAMPGNIEILRYRAIELMVLLSRAAAPEDTAAYTTDTDPARGDTLLETNNRYLNRILESKTAEEIIDTLNAGAERIAGKIFSFQGMRHASALRKAERYIWEHYTRKLSLEEIAKASGLSAPYFSTIFKEEMGENLSSYLNRLRVQRTVTMLTETGKPLREIAKLCGFEDQSWFSKIFKSFTGTSPGKFRENGGTAFECNR